jgi:asparagine synthase (glutamine-hydrolysing)
MCGIAGAFSPSKSFRFTLPYLAAMRDAIAHRGPDGIGAWISPDQSVGLAHRRLAIIDLSDVALQPMGNNDGSVQIVFNGEVYNHVELRKELDAQRPIRWRTDHSDTEVILRAYETWGIDCLHKLRGMFAFAIWDGPARRLWLCRDRFGIKPLYWSSHHGRFAFASEIKALLTDPDQPRALNEPAMMDYLSLMCTPAPETLFAGIRKVPAGAWVRIDGSGTVTESRWYELWDHVNPDRVARGNAIYDQVRELVTDAVQSHQASDVPMGVFLSGGVDSSTIAVRSRLEEGERLNTFSIGYHGDYQTYGNELTYARQIAESLGANHHERLLTEQDLVDFLPRMVHLQDEPIADPVCVPVYYVSQLARDHGVKVCQVGEGADELFYGYPFWRQWTRLQELGARWRSTAAMRAARSLTGLAGFGHSRAFDVLSRAAAGRPVFWTSAEGLTRQQRESILGVDLRSRYKAHDSWQAVAPLWARFERSASERSALNWMTFAELNLRLPELLLMRVDKMGMGASLEARVPFLDHHVVELAMSMTQAMRTQGGESKHLLKQAMRGHLPDNIIDRPKRGFGVPVREWLGGALGQRIERELQTFADETGLFDMHGVRALLRSSSKVRSWYLYNFVLWHRLFIEGVPQDRLISAA